MSERTGKTKNVGRVLTRQTTSAHGDVGLRPSVVSLSNQEAANPTCEAHDVDRWEVARLGDFCELRYGKIVRKMELSARGYPVWSGYSVVGYHDDYMFEKPQVTITCRGVGGTGNVHMTPSKCWVTNLAISIIPRDQNRVDKSFLYWAMKSTNRSNLITGSAQHQITIDHLSRHSVPLPPPPEQKTIAHILGSLDDKIELNRRMNATLEAMARALFQSWFVDFDPVRAKLDGRKPIGLDDATAALFPAAFHDSPIGEIPHGWRIGTLGELVQLRTDRVDATPTKDATRYIALEDMPSKSIDLSNFQLGSAVNSSIMSFRKGDILFGSMRPYFHKVGLTFFDGITRTTTFVLRPRKDCFRHFALLHFYSDDVVAYATTTSVGTTIPYVKWDSLECYPIPIPPDPLLAAFEKTVTPLVQRIAAQGEESRTLATLRDTLLPKLLSGELSVKSIEVLDA